MSKLGDDLIRSMEEAEAFVKGRAKTKEYRVHVPKRINVGAFIGHTPLRLYAMGEEAVERAATDDEIEAMRRIVLEAMAAGALGYATSRSPTHAGIMNGFIASRPVSWISAAAR